MEQNGVTPCFACPVLQFQGLVMACSTTNLPTSKTLMESQPTYLRKPQISLDRYKKSELDTRFNLKFMSHEKCNPIFPFPITGWKCNNSDAECYPHKYAVTVNTSFDSKGTLRIVQATAVTKSLLRSKYADCKYCSTTCYEENSHAECSECHAVLYDLGSNTKKPSVAVHTFSRDQTWQGCKLDNFNLLVTPIDDMEYNKPVAETRRKICSNRECDEAMMNREGGRHPNTEQVHNTIFNIQTTKKSAKKTLRRAFLNLIWKG